MLNHFLQSHLLKEAKMEPVSDATSPPEADLEKRIEASLILGGVGDAIGYKNGEWEFCRSGVRIHDALSAMGGVEKISVNPHGWMVSDDTVMQIATAEALLTDWDNDKEKLYSALATKYIESMRDMAGRAPGLTCGSSVHMLRPGRPKGYVIPFNPRGGGCGAAMRSVPIGLLYWRPEDIQELIAIAIESGRMTHNHPTGYLGSLATALFVSYSVQRKPLKEWGCGLMETLDLAWKYVEQIGRDVADNQKSWPYFKKAWTEYLTKRGLLDGKDKPTFPENYDVVARDKFYKSVSFSGCGGASGHDAPMIAYDALLSSRWSWSELCLRGMLHGGDSDSTGIIVGACWGAWHGYKDVPEGHYKKLEYRDRMQKLGKKLYEKFEKMQA